MSRPTGESRECVTDDLGGRLELGQMAILLASELTQRPGNIHTSITPFLNEHCPTPWRSLLVREAHQGSLLLRELSQHELLPLDSHPKGFDESDVLKETLPILVTNLETILQENTIELLLGSTTKELRQVLLGREGREGEEFRFAPFLLLDGLTIGR